jgi:PEP-CTERM motif
LIGSPCLVDVSMCNQPHPDAFLYQYTFTVPEPSTLWLVLAALGMIVGTMRFVKADDGATAYNADLRRSPAP